jgi:hypothetical protein
MRPGFRPFVVPKPLQQGNVVRTPTGREAEVLGFWNEHVMLRYLDDNDQVQLRPGLLSFLRVSITDGSP